MRSPFVDVRWTVVLLAAVCVASAGEAVEATPAAGRYAGELCVSISGRSPSCGPAEVDFGAGGEARVRISDIVYQLRLVAAQVDVVLMHGAMQIDEFSVPYEWVGNVLRFEDREKSARYEIRVTRGERR